MIIQEIQKQDKAFSRVADGARIPSRKSEIKANTKFKASRIKA
jgi:hypothetical protein